jgi:hypothetical protein
MTWLLSRHLWRAIAVAAVLAGLGWAYHLWAERQREIGRVEVRVEWQADKLARAEQNRILLMANAKQESDLQAAADIERKALNDKNLSIGRQLADSLERLRDRPERPEPAPGGERVPAVAGAGATGSGHAGCTGDRLYRDDSEALVRLGAAGDRLRIALRSCQAQYQRAQGAWNSVTPSKP